MGKRKRANGGLTAESNEGMKQRKVLSPPQSNPFKTSIQIVTGSYDRVLHGILATISDDINDVDGVSEGMPSVQFSDTFLFAAHRSAIRCLAISPPSTSEDASAAQKVILASGSTDERINLYHISAIEPSSSPISIGPKAVQLGRPEALTRENSDNRELGSLLHHSSSVNAVCFPSRSKLVSASEDSSISIIRTRDWTELCSIKAPVSRAIGRPSGDTAPLGTSPSGINDFAIHPSMKLMITVGKGEKCMRLWNLVTGKKASVLNFHRHLLQQVLEGKWGSGEGRRVAWNDDGDEFVVAFEKGAVSFGMNSLPKGLAITKPISKIHQVRYLPSITDASLSSILAMSTEDGRIAFFSAQAASSDNIQKSNSGETNSTKTNGTTNGIETKSIETPMCELRGQLGGKQAGVESRIKDFEILLLPDEGIEASRSCLLIAASSDGSIRIWKIFYHEFLSPNLAEAESEQEIGSHGVAGESAAGRTSATESPKQVGQLIGRYDTSNRVTCIKAFILRKRLDGGLYSNNDSGEEFEGIVSDSES